MMILLYQYLCHSDLFRIIIIPQSWVDIENMQALDNEAHYHKLLRGTVYHTFFKKLQAFVNILHTPLRIIILNVFSACDKINAHAVIHYKC